MAEQKEKLEVNWFNVSILMLKTEGISHWTHHPPQGSGAFLGTISNPGQAPWLLEIVTGLFVPGTDEFPHPEELHGSPVQKIFFMSRNI